MHTKSLQDVQVAWMHGKPIPCTALLAFAITFWSSHSDQNRLDPKWARRLYSIELAEAARQANLVTPSPTPRQLATRDEVVIRLLAADPERQRMLVSDSQIQEAVKRRLGGLRYNFFICLQFFLFPPFLG